MITNGDGEVVVGLVLDGAGVQQGVRMADGSIKTLEATTKRAQGTLGRLGSSLKAALLNPLTAVVAGVLSVGRAVSFLTDSVKAAGEAEIAARRLTQALKNLGEADPSAAAARLQEIASRIQSVTNFEDEMVTTSAQVLATFKAVGGAEGIGLLLPRLADMAAGVAKATGETVDLNSVAIAVGKSLEGSATILRRYGVSLSATQEASLKAASGMDRVRIIAEILDANFKGLAEAAADPFVILDHAVGELQEALGTGLRQALGRVADQFRAFVSRDSTVAWAKELGNRLGGLVTTMADVGRQALLMARDIQQTAQALNMLAGAESEVDTKGDQAAAALRVLRQLGLVVQGTFVALGGAIHYVGQQLTYVANFLSGGLLDGLLEKQAQTQERLRSRFQGIVGEFNDLSGEVARLNDPFGLNGRAPNTDETAFINHFRQAGQVTLDFNEAMRSLNQTAGETGPTLGDGPGGAAKGADEFKSAMDRAKDALASVHRELVDLHGTDLGALGALLNEREKQEAEIERLTRFAQAVDRVGLALATLHEISQRGGTGIIPGAPAFGAVAPRGPASLDGGGVMDGVIRQGISPKDLDRYIAAKKAIIAANEELQASFIDLGPSISGGLGDAVAAIGEAIGQMAAGTASFADLGASLLSALGRLATRLGETMIQFGIAALALKKLIKDPLTAIIAGTALVALGAVLEAEAGRIVSDGTGGGGGYSYGARAGTSSIAAGLAIPGSAYAGGGAGGYGGGGATVNVVVEDHSQTHVSGDIDGVIDKIETRKVIRTKAGVGGGGL